MSIWQLMKSVSDTRTHIHRLGQDRSPGTDPITGFAQFMDSDSVINRASELEVEFDRNLSTSKVKEISFLKL